jgi:hypothetical protein
MSTQHRGTKRSADGAPGGREFKSAKSGGGGGFGFNKGGNGGFNKGGNGGFNKGGNGGFNKGGHGKSFGGKGGNGGFNKGNGNVKPAWQKGGNGGNGNSGFKGKGKAAPRERDEEPAAKRKRPVTQGGGEEDAMSVDEDELDDDEYDGEDVEMGGEGDEGAAAGEEKKGKMTKEEREALHAQQPHRRTLLASHGLLTDTLLPLWENARRAEMPKEERKAAIAELYEAVKGRVLEISRGHKGGRVLQTVS